MADSQANNIHIRAAKKEDMKAVADMIQMLADIEKMSHGPQISAKDLEHDGFERVPPAFQCNLAIDNSIVNNPVVGYAVFYSTYSTWDGHGHTMILEDLYVRDNQRRTEIGKKLLQSVVEVAKSRGYNHIDIHVLGWHPTRSFYEGEGAVDLSTKELWYSYRLPRDALQKATSE